MYDLNETRTSTRVCVRWIIGDEVVIVIVRSPLSLSRDLFYHTSSSTFHDRM